MKYNRHKKEIQRITEFKEAFIAYTLIDQQRYPTNEDNVKQLELREKLDNLNGEVSMYVHKAGISASITYTPPPIIGGYVRNIDFFSNLFNLDTFSIPPQSVIDSLDRALGNYNIYNQRFIKKIINPFHWLGELIRIPFYLARFAGFDEQKIELSLFGKLYKFILSFILYCAALLQILSLLGVDTKIDFSTIWNKKNDTKSIQLKDTNPKTTEHSTGSPLK